MPRLGDAKPFLQWEEGPKNRGCSYHQLARFHSAFASGQLDVFVMPRIATRRPIAITINVRTLARKRTLKGSIATSKEATSLGSRLTPRLVGLGWSEERAGRLSDALTTFILGHAIEIDAALSGARH